MFKKCRRIKTDIKNKLEEEWENTQRLEEENIELKRQIDELKAAIKQPS